MFNSADMILINYVSKTLNSGLTKIEIPAHLLKDVNREAILEVKRKCKLAGATIKNIQL